MFTTFSSSPSIWAEYWYRWNHFWHLVWLHERILKLDELILWAKRKQLVGVQQAYQRHLILAQLKLQDTKTRQPNLYRQTRFVYELVNAFTPQKQHYSKRYAKRY